ncbi:oxidoreductase [Rhizobium sp. AC44/96]|uniref:Gfo/Idh/MocA family protein n=1 Tax=Rhizobium sp. AC44/96 TaxID=1841654 RepID=UPI00080F867D|nr:Gfo/Idh/MocA family oxidoreductase [Rhizobium sp. AC44/96]OCJ17264.1 oxidoreductase [Rhizobium sp. AC44/96]
MPNLVDDVGTGGRPLRVGMIGGGKGSFFAGVHRAAMRLAGRFEIVAGVFSSTPSVSREAGVALGVPGDRIYPTFTAMAAGEVRRSDGIDLCVIVTPNHLHYEPCRIFLEAGIPIVCDKPLVNASAEARELVSLADRHDTFAAVTYTYTGYPMVRDARSRVRDGEIGDVKFLYVEYLLEWLANDPSKIGKGGIWRGDPAKAGLTGALGDVGTHAFNILEFVSGMRCTAVNANLQNTVAGFGLDDTDVVQLKFGDDAQGLLWCSLAAPGHRNGLRFKIVGTKGTLEWCQEQPETLHLHRMAQADLIYRRGGSDMTEDGMSCVSLPAGNPEAYLEALAVLYADYAKALLSGRDWRKSLRVPLTDLREGLRGVVLSEVCLQSSTAQKWEAFPDA